MLAYIVNELTENAPDCLQGRQCPPGASSMNLHDPFHIAAIHIFCDEILSIRPIPYYPATNG